MRIERTLKRNQTDQQTWQVKVSKINELICKVHDNEDWHQTLYWQTLKCPLNSYPEKKRDLIRVAWKRSLNSQTGHISHATNFLESTSTDSLSECVFRSHDQSSNFSGNTETDSQTECVFRFHDQSCNFSGNTETDSPPGYVFRSHDQSCNFSGNIETDSPISGPMISHATYQDRLTSWMCFQVP